MLLDREGVTSIAQAEVESRGWPWVEPVKVIKSRKWFLVGPVQWEVVTNTEYRGGNVFVMIDDKTGKVLGSRFYSY